MCSAQREQRLLEHSSAAVTACLPVLDWWNALTRGSCLRALHDTFGCGLAPVCFGLRLTQYAARTHQIEAGGPGRAHGCESSR